MSNDSGGNRDDSRFQKISFLIILTAISLGFLYMVRNFVLTLLMAGVFTGLSHPLYDFLLRRLRKPPLAALATLSLLIVVLVLPVAAVITVAYHEAWNIFRAIDFSALPGTLAHVAQGARDSFPTLFSRLSPEDISQGATLDLREAFQWIVHRGAAWSLALVSNLASFLLMLFMMFYFYMDGKRILDVIMRWSPLRDDYGEILLHKFLSVSRATLKGILIIGIIQGTLGTVLFWAVGLKSPVFLGLLMVFCTVLPIVGVSVVWIPAAVYLFIQGRMGAGVAVLLVGTVIISAIDNLLRPRLVGHDIKMHDLMVLLSTLGGLGLFGLPGFVMGPILASLFISIWTMFEEVFAEELARTRVPPPSGE